MSSVLDGQRRRCVRRGLALATPSPVAVLEPESNRGVYHTVLAADDGDGEDATNDDKYERDEDEKEEHSSESAAAHEPQGPALVRF